MYGGPLNKPDADRIKLLEVDRVLREIERAYGRDLLRFVRLAQAIVGSRELAEEVVHDAFAAAIRARDGYRGPGPVDGWLWRIVVNAARRALRDGRPHAADVPLDAAVVGEAPPAPALAAVSPLVAALPERQRLVVFLRYYADLDYRAIAEVLGVTVGTVSASLSAAHAQLRTALEATADG